MTFDVKISISDCSAQTLANTSNVSAPDTRDVEAFSAIMEQTNSHDNKDFKQDVGRSLSNATATMLFSTGELPSKTENMSFTSEVMSSESKNISFTNEVASSESKNMYFLGESVRSEGKNISFESKDIPFVGENISFESRNSLFTSEAMPSDSKKISFINEAVSSESRNVSLTGELVPSESRNVSLTGELVPSESRNVSLTGEVIPSDSKKVSLASEAMSFETKNVSSASEDLSSMASLMSQMLSTVPKDVTIDHGISIEKDSAAKISSNIVEGPRKEKSTAALFEDTETLYSNTSNAFTASVLASMNSTLQVATVQSSMTTVVTETTTVTAPHFTAKEIDAMVTMLVERITVTDTTAHMVTVEVSLSDTALRGTSLSLTRSLDGLLTVNVLTNDSAIFQTLVGAQVDLRSKLEAMETGIVRVEISHENQEQERDPNRRSATYQAYSGSDSDQGFA